MTAKAIELVRAVDFLATNFPPRYELSEHYLVDPSFVTTMVQRPVMEIFEELRTQSHGRTQRPVTLLFYEPISEGQPPKFLKMTPEFCGDSFCGAFVEDFEGIEEDECGKRLAIWVKNDSDIVTLILPKTVNRT